MKLVLVDGMFFVRRSLASAERNMPRRPEDEVWTAPLYMAFRTLQSLVKQYPAKYIFCWDRGHGGREKIDPQYKASRDKYDPTDLVFTFAHEVEQMVEAAGFNNAWCDGYEADDVIASLALLARLPSVEEVRIFSTDYDFFALITEKVKCWRPGIAAVKEVVAEAEYCKKRFGVLPQYVTLLKALTGDDSDEYAGVPIGRKKEDLKTADFVLIIESLKVSSLCGLTDAIQDGTAHVALVAKYGSDEIAQKKVHVLYENLDRIQKNFALATMLASEVSPRLNVKVGQFNREVFREFLQAFGFQSILSKFEEVSQLFERIEPCQIS